jgi:hypothetical protein
MDGSNLTLSSTMNNNNNNNNNKHNVLLDKLKNITHLKEDSDLSSIRQCTPISGFHFPWRSQHIFCQIQVCHLGLLLQLHWIFTTHTMSKTIPIYQNMTSLKKLNARISQTCHLKYRLSLQEMDVCWHVYAPRGSHMKLRRTEADMFHSILIPSKDML